MGNVKLYYYLCFKVPAASSHLPCFRGGPAAPGAPSLGWGERRLHLQCEPALPGLARLRRALLQGSQAGWKKRTGCRRRGSCRTRSRQHHPSHSAGHGLLWERRQLVIQAEESGLSLLKRVGPVWDFISTCRPHRAVRGRMGNSHPGQRAGWLPEASEAGLRSDVGRT